MPEQKQDMKKFGGFQVFSFDLPHDGTENRGFLIRKNDEVILYMTDFQYCKYKFYPNIAINHMIIEANYAKEFISNYAINRTHVFRGHAELQTTLDFIKKNQSPKLQTVILSHLSAGNADKAYFIDEASKIVRCGLYVAEKGLKIELGENKNDKSE